MLSGYGTSPVVTSPEAVTSHSAISQQRHTGVIYSYYCILKGGTPHTSRQGSECTPFQHTEKSTSYLTLVTSSLYYNCLSTFIQMISNSLLYVLPSLKTRKLRVDTEQSISYESNRMHIYLSSCIACLSNTRSSMNNRQLAILCISY